MPDLTKNVGKYHMPKISYFEDQLSGNLPPAAVVSFSYSNRTIKLTQPPYYKLYKYNFFLSTQHPAAQRSSYHPTGTLVQPLLV